MKFPPTYVMVMLGRRRGVRGISLRVMRLEEAGTSNDALLGYLGLAVPCLRGVFTGAPPSIGDAGER